LGACSLGVDMEFEDDDIFERLGEVKPITKDTSYPALNETFGVHRAAIQALAGDAARQREAAEKMRVEMEKELKQAKKNESAIWVPGGEASRMDARYLLPDGSVRLGNTKLRYSLPDGSTDEVSVPGLLTDPYPVTREQQRLQNAYAGMAVAFRRAVALRIRAPWTDPLVRLAFRSFRRSALDMPGRTGDFLRSMYADPELWKRVISGTAGSGGEMINNPTTAEIRRPTYLLRRIPGLVKTREAVSSTFKQPIVTGKALGRRRGTTSNDPATYPVQQFTTSDAAVVVVDRVINSLLDPNWINDAGNVLADPMGEVVDWLMQGDADTLELAFLHGDTASSHQDAIDTWTLGSYYTAGRLGGSDSPAKFWIGWRARAVDDSATASAGGTWEATDHWGTLELMGSLGAGAVTITGLHCLYTQLVSNSLFLTIQNYGNAATLVTGEIGSIGGKPLIISEFITNDFDSTNGLFTGSNASTEMLFVNTDKYTHYEHTSGSDDYDVTYPEKGAQYVGMQRRSVLTCEATTGEKPCALLYNL